MAKAKEFYGQGEESVEDPGLAAMRARVRDQRRTLPHYVAPDGTAPNADAAKAEATATTAATDDPILAAMRQRVKASQDAQRGENARHMREARKAASAGPERAGHTGGGSRTGGTGTRASRTRGASGKASGKASTTTHGTSGAATTSAGE